MRGLKFLNIGWVLLLAGPALAAGASPGPSAANFELSRGDDSAPQRILDDTYGARAATQLQLERLGQPQGRSPEPTAIEKHLGEKGRPDCGVGCLYSKANEVEALQAVYLIRRMDRLTGIYNTRSQDKDWDSKLKGELGSFCTTGDSGESCFKRYARFQSQALIELKSAMNQNAMSRDALKNENLRLFENRGEVAPSLAQTPFLPTAEELGLDPKGSAGAMAGSATNQRIGVSKGEYQKWLSRLTAEPKKEDFLMFKTVDRYPGTASSEKLRVIDRDKNGEPKYDLSKYNDAKKKYEAGLDRLKQDVAAMFQEARSRSVSEAELKNFQESRNLVVNQVNQLLAGIQGGGVAAQERAPAQNGRPGAATASKQTSSPQTKGASPQAVAGNVTGAQGAVGLAAQADARSADLKVASVPYGSRELVINEVSDLDQRIFGREAGGDEIKQRVKGYLDYVE